MPSSSDHVARQLAEVLTRVTRPESPPLAALKQRVRAASARVSDQEVQALRDAGHSDDEILDAVISAAVDEGLRRLTTGVSLLRGGR